MAEDRFNPLNNADVARQMDRPVRTRPEAPPEDDFAGLLDEFFGTAPGQAPGNDPETDTGDTGEEREDQAPTPAGTSVPAVSLQPPSVADREIPSPPRVPTPEPTVTYNGQQYTLAELAQNGLLADALRKAQQFDAQQQVPVPQTQQQAPVEQRAPSVVELQDAYAPVIRQAVDQGYLDADVANLYPATTTSMMHLRTQVDQLIQVMTGMAQWVNTQQRQSMLQTVERQIDDALTQAASRGPAFAALNSPEERQAARQLLRDLNPLIEQITPDFVARQWLAAKTEQLIAHHMATGQPWVVPAAPTPVMPQGQRPAAAPPRASGRGTRQTVPEPGDPWDDMLEGLL